VEQADLLRELLAACHRVLPKLEDMADNRVAETIRETCRAIEARLQELGATSSSGQAS
jgi:hypothetical protein